MFDDFSKLTGRAWKHGEKVKPFAERFQMLGVEVNLGTVTSAGTAEVSNTLRRREELKESIGQMLQKGKLTEPEAESLVGRLQFASSQTFGRVGASALKPLRKRAQGISAGTEITWGT